MNNSTDRILRSWPQAPNDPVSNLLHTIDAFHVDNDDEYVLIATHNVYGPGVKTGLTRADLRHIASLISTW